MRCIALLSKNGSKNFEKKDQNEESLRDLEN